MMRYVFKDNCSSAGFDGGMEPSYRLRYRLFTNTEDGYHYVDVLTPNATSFVLTGLAMATDYTVSIMAFNKLGSSKYLPDLLKARTSSECSSFFNCFGIWLCG
jgi:nephron